MPRKTRGNPTPKIVEAARDNRSSLTAAERKLWNVLRGRKLAGLKFRLQHPFGRFVLDFFCLERMLAIEVDGGIHDEPEQKEYDADRTQFLNDQGIRVLRVQNQEVLSHIDQVLSKIIQATEDDSLPLTLGGAKSAKPASPTTPPLLDLRSSPGEGDGG